MFNSMRFKKICQNISEHVRAMVNSHMVGNHLWVDFLAVYKQLIQLVPGKYPTYLFRNSYPPSMAIRETGSVKNTKPAIPWLKQQGEQG